MKFAIKILAAYPNTSDRDCTEETFEPSGKTTMAHPGNLSERLGQLLRDGWEPIGAGYSYPSPEVSARPQIALRKAVQSERVGRADP